MVDAQNIIFARMGSFKNGWEGFKEVFEPMCLLSQPF